MGTSVNLYWASLNPFKLLVKCLHFQERKRQKTKAGSRAIAKIRNVTPLGRRGTGVVHVQMQDREADDQTARAEDTRSVEGEEPGTGRLIGEAVGIALSRRRRWS